MKTIKSDSDSDSDEQKKVTRFFRKNRGVTPSVAAPGVTHPSDATGLLQYQCNTQRRRCTNQDRRERERARESEIFYKLHRVTHLQLFPFSCLVLFSSSSCSLPLSCIVAPSLQSALSSPRRFLGLAWLPLPFILPS